MRQQNALAARLLSFRSHQVGHGSRCWCGFHPQSMAMFLLMDPSPCQKIICYSKLDNVSTVHFPMKVRWSADNVRERIEYKTDEDNWKGEVVEPIDLLAVDEDAHHHSPHIRCKQWQVKHRGTAHLNHQPSVSMKYRMNFAEGIIYC